MRKTVVALLIFIVTIVLFQLTGVAATKAAEIGGACCPDSECYDADAEANYCASGFTADFNCDSPNCPNFQGSCSITCRPGGGGGGGTCRCGLNNQGGCASCAGPTCNLGTVDCPLGSIRGSVIIWSPCASRDIRHV